MVLKKGLIFVFNQFEAPFFFFFSNYVLFLQVQENSHHHHHHHHHSRHQNTSRNGGGRRVKEVVERRTVTRVVERADGTIIPEESNVRVFEKREVRDLDGSVHDRSEYELNDESQNLTTDFRNSTTVDEFLFRHNMTRSQAGMNELNVPAVGISSASTSNTTTSATSASGYGRATTPTQASTSSRRAPY